MPNFISMQDDLDDFLEKIDKVSRAVEKIKDGTITETEIDVIVRDVAGEEVQELNRKQREEERKKAETDKLLEEGRSGSGIAEDCKLYCPACRWEFLRDNLSSCNRCHGKLVSRADRKKELDEKVKELMEAKERRKERREQFAKWQETRKKDMDFKGKSADSLSIDYQGWDFWEPESEDEDRFVPPTDGGFQALEADFKERAAKRAAAKQKALEFKEKGNEFFKLDKLEDAIQCYSDGISVHKAEKSLYTNRAACFIKLKQWGEAVKDCTTVVDIYTYLDQKKLEPSERTSPTPIVFKAFMRRAESRRSLKAYKLALEDVAEALKLRPQNKNALALKKQLEADLVEVEKALKVLQSVQLSVHESQKENSHVALKGLDTFESDQGHSTKVSNNFNMSSAELSIPQLPANASGPLADLTRFVIALKQNVDTHTDTNTDTSSTDTGNSIDQKINLEKESKTTQEILSISDENRAVLLHLNVIPLAAKYVEREFGEDNDQAPDSQVVSVLSVLIALALYSHARDDIANSVILNILAKNLASATLGTQKSSPATPSRLSSNLKMKLAVWSLLRSLSEYTVARQCLALEQIPQACLAEIDAFVNLYSESKAQSHNQQLLELCPIIPVCTSLLGNLCYDVNVKKRLANTSAKGEMSMPNIITKLICLTIEPILNISSKPMNQKSILITQSQIFSIQRSCMQVLTNAWGDSGLRKEILRTTAEIKLQKKGSSNVDIVSINATAAAAFIFCHALKEFEMLEFTTKVANALSTSLIGDKQARIESKSELSVAGKANEDIEHGMDPLGRKVFVKTSNRGDSVAPVRVLSTECQISDCITETCAYLLNASLDSQGFSSFSESLVIMLEPLRMFCGPTLSKDTNYKNSVTAILLETMVKFIMRTAQANSRFAGMGKGVDGTAKFVALPLDVIERLVAFISRLLTRDPTLPSFFVNEIGGHCMLISVALSVMTQSYFTKNSSTKQVTALPIEKFSSMLDQSTRGLVACIVDQNQKAAVQDLAAVDFEESKCWVSYPKTWLFSLTGSNLIGDHQPTLKTIAEWLKLHSSAEFKKFAFDDISPLSFMFALSLFSSLDKDELQIQASSEKGLYFESASCASLLSYLVNQPSRQLGGNAALAIGRVASYYLSQKQQGESGKEASLSKQLLSLPQTFEKAKILDGLMNLMRGGDEGAAKNAATACASVARMSTGLVTYLREKDGFKMLQFWSQQMNK